MSGLVLTYSRDGASPDAGLLNTMLEALRHRGPDGCDTLLAPGTAIGSRHFWTTPEAVGNRQPLQDPERKTFLVLDGRLDNRQELFDALGIPSGEVVKLSDAALTLRAYARWEEGCFERLLGSFAVAVYDAALQKVVCARDSLGDHTLFYYLDHRVLVVASEECAVLAHPRVSRRFDEDRLAEHFALQSPTLGSTFFADVKELLPAHFLVCTPRKVRLQSYWEPPRTVRFEGRSDDLHAERFLELLRESVRCRVRSPSRPGIMMSGGLDSGPAGALASREPTVRASGKPLLAVSWVFDELTDCDERPYIDLLTRTFDLEPLHIKGDGAWPLRRADCLALNPNTPVENLYRDLKNLVYRGAAQAGVRVLLNCADGDNLYTGADWWLLDFLRDSRSGEGRQALVSLLRRRGLWRLLNSPMVRGPLDRFRPSWLRRSARRPPWLTGEAWERVSRTARRTQTAYTGFDRPSQAEAILGGWAAMAPLETFHAGRHGLELRDPYRDRRLVEFMMTIPAHLLYREAVGFKVVLRQAFKGILPEEYLLAGRHGTLEALHRRMVERESSGVRALLDAVSPRIERYVRPDWLARARPGHMASDTEEVVIWDCALFELWARRRQEQWGVGSGQCSLLEESN